MATLRATEESKRKARKEASEHLRRAHACLTAAGDHGTAVLLDQISARIKVRLEQNNKAAVHN
jgi:preprotein translocase subunit YajC